MIYAIGEIKKGRVKQLLGLTYPYPKIMDISKTANVIGIGYKVKN